MSLDWSAPRCGTPRADRRRPVCGREATVQYTGPSGLRYDRCASCAAVIDRAEWIRDQAGYRKVEVA